MAHDHKTSDSRPGDPMTNPPASADPRIKTEAEWRATLSPQAYRITREHGTERAFTSPLNGEKRAGSYHCVCCGAPLFESAAKYDSGSGWPSFTRPAADAAVSEHDDRSLFA